MPSCARSCSKRPARRTWRRGWKAGIIAIAAALSASAFLPGCTLGYVLSSGYHQAELLASRRPIDAVLADYAAHLVGPAHAPMLDAAWRDFETALG